MNRSNCEHLRENDQNYFAHMKDAWMFSVKTFAASTAFFIHGVFPFAFKHTGSSLVNNVQTFIKKKDERIKTRNTVV